MKLTKITLLSILFLTSILSFGQDDPKITQEDVDAVLQRDNEGEMVRQSSSMLQEGYLYYAEKITDVLLTKKPESCNYNYRKGYLMMEIRRDFKGAIPHLEKAIENLDNNYDMYGVNEKSAPTDALFHLAQCYHLDEQLDKAEEMYTRFEQESRKKSEYLPVAALRKAQISNAREALKTPVDVQLVNVGNKVNSEFADYSPVISLDGGSLYFTSRRPWTNGETEQYLNQQIHQYPEDVYVSYKDFDNEWTEPAKLEFCKPKDNEATVAVSTDERKIYLYNDSTGLGDIYTTDFYHAKFQEIESLNIDGVNTKDYWETHAMMAHDNSMLLFVSDREGGFGGRDIYMVKRTGDSTWSDPINLGPNVNTSEDEDAPFIAIDNKTVYFSSNGNKSIGGFDIFKTTINEDGTCSVSENLGYPFNSTNDDIFYTTTVDGKTGYMTTYRDNGYGEKDIYEIRNEHLGVKDVAVLRGLIKTVDDKPIPEDFAINIKLICLDCDEPESSRLIYPRLRDGVFTTGLEPCKTYKLEYMNITDNNIMYEDGFVTECTEEYQEIHKELLLDVDSRTIIVPADTQDIDPVIAPEMKQLEFMHYFSYNKNKLSVKKGDLKQFVKEIETLLEDGRESITLNVYSSASRVPTRKYKTNENLANIRAENMKYDLVAYFEGNEKLKGKVNVVVVSAQVQGPEYESDAKNKDKYKPYQYIGLKTE